MIESASITEADFKEKARRLIFKSGLRDFPVIFEMYVKTFGLNKVGFDLDKAMGDVLTIVRSSANEDVAYSKVSTYLTSLE